MRLILPVLKCVSLTGWAACFGHDDYKFESYTHFFLLVKNLCRL